MLFVLHFYPFNNARTSIYTQTHRHAQNYTQNRATAGDSVDDMLIKRTLFRFPLEAELLFNSKRDSIAQNLSLSPFHCPDKSEILLKRTRN